MKRFSYKERKNSFFDYQKSTTRQPCRDNG